jgi:hypothetical protein
MARFGVEAIRYFNHARAADVDTAGDLTYAFNRSNGLDAKLRSAGHTRAFYWANTNVFETDLRDGGQDGADRNRAGVDLLWIETHGSHDDAGRATFLHDIPATAWYANSADWQQGEGWNKAWVMAYACDTAALPAIDGLWNIFARMHIFCGAWDAMYDGITTDECGEDIGDSLIHGDTIAHAWHDGVSDWWIDNHPVTVCVGDAATWNDGSIRWELSAINRDHLWGHGSVSADLAPARQACLLWYWTEG